jgi:hypothetical protein
MKETGQIAYEAYGDRVSWKTYRNEPMPPWGRLPALIQAAWMEAAHAVIQHGWAEAQR